MNHASSKEIAEKLGISARQARRLRANDDPRLSETDTGYLARCSAERLGAVCVRQAVAVGIAAAILQQAPQSESLQAGPQIDQLNGIITRLRKLVSELQELGHALYPK